VSANCRRFLTELRLQRERRGFGEREESWEELFISGERTALRLRSAFSRVEGKRGATELQGGDRLLVRRHFSNDPQKTKLCNRRLLTMEVRANALYELFFLAARNKEGKAVQVGSFLLIRIEESSVLSGSRRNLRYTKGTHLNYETPSDPIDVLRGELAGRKSAIADVGSPDGKKRGRPRTPRGERAAQKAARMLLRGLFQSSIQRKTNLPIAGPKLCKDSKGGEGSITS